MHINISTPQGIYPWRPTAWLRVTGEDAAIFLQGQFSNDLRQLGQPGVPAIYGLWLTLKGKVLADSFVMRGSSGNEFWIGSYYSPGEVIRERLESHIIADDVGVEDVTAEWAGVSVLGDGAAALVTGAAPPEARVFPGRRQRGDHVECVYRLAEGATEWLARLGGPILGDEAMLRARIAAGIPAVPRDVGPGDLPNEAGLEAEAVSFTKGCYLGQEVMARLKAMGQVRRRLVRVGGPGERFPATPAPIFSGERGVGDLRSAVSDGAGGWIGLAMLTRMHVMVGADLAFAAPGGPALHLLEEP